MNLPSLVTDNITEVLVKIIEFTQARQKLLIQNINNMRSCGFVPKDLDVGEFSVSMDNAVNEHITNQRLVLCDTKNIKFGIDGNFEVKPITDKHAHKILEESRDEYLDLQINKLMENSINQRVATELLRQKQN